MSEPSKELEQAANQNIEIAIADAAIEQFKAGGIIESAIGGYEPSMDRVISDHLANVAMLEARGDTSPERPVYMFNPDTGLLINYALRRNEDPAKSGLFADVVELDAQGKPRHGVGVVNPFESTKGFINVSVGDNPHGFAPSYTELKLDSEDPTSTVPPNIETADLLAMLSGDVISEDETPEDFVARKQQARDEFRDKVRARQNKRYFGTVQAFDELSNPDMHLIISDRDDASHLTAASREAGLFPLLVTGDEVIDHLTTVGSIADAPEDLGLSIPELLRRTHSKLFDWLGSNTVSFVTVDVATEKRWDEQTQRDVMVEMPRPKWSRQEDGSVQWSEMPRSQEIIEFTQAITRRSPIFARVLNHTFHSDYSSDGHVRKEGHGDYIYVPTGSSPENLQGYTDWLRKVRLDMALTLYLRGLNQIG